LLQYRNIGIGVFPEDKKVPIRDLGFRSIALQPIGAGKTEMRQRADGLVDYDPAA
jgi:hypothetical protein